MIGYTSEKQAIDIAKAYCKRGAPNDYAVLGDALPDGAYVNTNPQEAFWIVKCPRQGDYRYVLDGSDRILLIGKQSGKVITEGTYSEV